MSRSDRYLLLLAPLVLVFEITNQLGYGACTLLPSIALGMWLLSKSREAKTHESK